MPNAVLVSRREYHLPGTAARAARLPHMAEARLELKSASPEPLPHLIRSWLPLI
jgi:hypothetical protein